MISIHVTEDGDVDLKQDDQRITLRVSPKGNAAELVYCIKAAIVAHTIEDFSLIVPADAWEEHEH